MIAKAIALTVACVGFACLLLVAHLATLPVLVLAVLATACLSVASTELT